MDQPDGLLCLFNQVCARETARVLQRKAKTLPVREDHAVLVRDDAVFGAVQDPSGFKAALWRMSPQTVRVTQTIPLGGVRGYPPTLEVAVGEGAVWATNYDAGTLVRIDPTTGAIVSTIHLGGHPWSLAVGAHRVWVTVN